METGSRPIGRPPDKLALVAMKLRSQIIEGVLAPGTQLPPRAQLEQAFGVSNVTVQRAIDSLRRDGFVHTSTRGTYVAPNPPHLCRYALSFSGRPASLGSWSIFHNAIQQAATAIGSDPQTQFAPYFEMDAKAESPDFHRLLADVHHRRLAGIVFVWPPYTIAHTDIVLQPGMPRAGIMADPFVGIPAVSPDVESFIDRAIQFLASRGRHRVAVLGTNVFHHEEQRVFAAARKHGLLVRPQWIQAASHQNAYAASHVAQLLMSARGEELPDGLIVTDDNLVEQTMAGLVVAGVRVPEDLEIVTHCNYPCPVPSVLPATRLGFDCGQVLRRCIEVINMQRRGEPTPQRVLVPALFEEELDKASRS